MFLVVSYVLTPVNVRAVDRSLQMFLGSAAAVPYFISRWRLIVRWTVFHAIASSQVEFRKTATA